MRLWENRNLMVIDGIDSKAAIWMETGEAYDRGFLKIKAADLYWRGEQYFSVFLGYDT